MSFALKFSVLLVVVLLVERSYAEKPTFRILAPEFMCPRTKSFSSNKGNTTEVAPEAPQQVTIGLQTKNGQRLRYRVSVNFTLLDGFVSQRHTLQLWRSVQELEKRIKTEAANISATNRINIPNDQLVSGVIYTFNIVGVNSDGETSQEQNFTLTFRGKRSGSAIEQDGSSTTQDVSLILMGAEVSYPDIPYAVTAKLIFCEPKNDYKLRWSIPGIDDPSILTTSNTLEIPANLLKAGSSYDINAAVVNSTSSNELVKARMKLRIIERALQGRIYPVEAIVGLGQPIQIRADYNQPALMPELSWSCTSVQTDADADCSDDLDIAGRTATVVFTKESSFRISAANGQLTLTSNIKVLSRSTISVRLQRLPALYLLPGNRFDLLADVSGLVPKCSSNWTVVSDPGSGSAYFNPEKLDSPLGGIFVNDVEENFLSELIDYGNDTIEREVKLTIPGRSEASGWTGLLPNSRYKLRLITKCAEPIDDSSDSPKERPIVTSTWDMILETNGLPEGQPLTMTPYENGTALSTYYQFSTGIAKEIASDYPLQYSFWYSVEGNSINIANYYEVMSTETQLPFSSSKISGYYLVCDSRLACARIEGTQSLLVQPNQNLDSSILHFRLDQIQKSFDRNSYREAIKLAFELALTLKNQQSDLYDEAYAKLIEILELQIPLM
ncbi:uncharacterized protein LOC129738036, partial [Uranotaenia lowii]|uniref:uncharacterized protein LOC129738036 n=1 Tax=Uranotaenia lowii TaxID=190385 RepID=UPI00247A51AB